MFFIAWFLIPGSSSAYMLLKLFVWMVLLLFCLCCLSSAFHILCSFSISFFFFLQNKWVLLLAASFFVCFHTLGFIQAFIQTFHWNSIQSACGAGHSSFRQAFNKILDFLQKKLKIKFNVFFNFWQIFLNLCIDLWLSKFSH